MKSTPVSVILPTYNEAENIVPLIRNIEKHIPNGSEILVVDDNSPDGTAFSVRNYMKETTHGHAIRLILRTANRGLTNSLKSGIQASKSSILLWMDCDFSHPPQVISRLLETIENGADLAIATRFGRIKSPTTTGLSTGLNTLLSFLFGSLVTDYTTGFLAIRKSVLSRIPLRGNYGEYCIELLVRAQKAGYRIEEVPYKSPPRRRGQSKTAPTVYILLRHGFGYIGTLIRLLWSIKLHPTSIV